MSKALLYLAMIAFTWLSCNPKNEPSQNAATHTPSEEMVPYTLAQRYFVKNTFQKNQLQSPIISNQKEFDDVFGMATVMGADGKPTVINFSDQIAITVILDETDRETEIQPEKLVSVNSNTLKLDYKITTGPSMTMTIRPFLLIFIDKKYKDYMVELESHIASK